VRMSSTDMSVAGQDARSVLASGAGATASEVMEVVREEIEREDAIEATPHIPLAPHDSLPPIEHDPLPIPIEAVVVQPAIRRSERVRQVQPRILFSQAWWLATTIISQHGR
jgi:hypothetical protein